MTGLVLLLALALLARKPASPSMYVPPARPKPNPAPPAARESPYAPVSTTPPWPQVVPSDLPAFPGPGWTPDVPVGPGVAARASQLLSELWKGGAGTKRIEQTAGRWIAYVAAMTGSKRGVVAYRLVAQVAPVPLVSTPVPVSAPSSTAVPASTSAVRMPTLKRGDKGPDVMALQRAFGWGKVTDFFGAQTEEEVLKRQRAAGLPATGIVDAATWSRIVGVAA